MSLNEKEHLNRESVLNDFIVRSMEEIIHYALVEYGREDIFSYLEDKPHHFVKSHGAEECYREGGGEFH